MPMMTQILRNGIPVPIRWGWWHLDMIAEAAEIPSPSGATDSDGKILYILPPDGFVFPCTRGFGDPTDHEDFYIYEGDVFRTWYGSRH